MTKATDQASGVVAGTLDISTPPHRLPSGSRQKR